MELTWEQVRARRLARSHLHERAPADRLVEVARDVCGMPARRLTPVERAGVEAEAARISAFLALEGRVRRPGACSPRASRRRSRARRRRRDHEPARAEPQRLLDHELEPEQAMTSARWSPRRPRSVALAIALFAVGARVELTRLLAGGGGDIFGGFGPAKPDPRWPEYPGRTALREELVDEASSFPSRSRVCAEHVAHRVDKALGAARRKPVLPPDAHRLGASAHNGEAIVSDGRWNVIAEGAGGTSGI